MTRYSLLFVLTVLPAAGCVPVTEPVGDIDKATPNKELVGTWQDDRSKEQWIVDQPEVKGNPKGLMRVRIVPPGKKLEDVSDGTIWFFTATVGKHTYTNVLVTNDGVDLSKEGAYAKWIKSPKRGFWVGKLTIDGDKLTHDSGGDKGFKMLMAAEKIELSGDFYQTKPGWLTAYLEKKGPDGIYGSPDADKLTRVKK